MLYRNKDTMPTKARVMQEYPDRPEREWAAGMMGNADIVIDDDRKGESERLLSYLQ